MILNLLLTVIPLDLASTLSPGILAITIYLLSNKYYKKAKLIAFFVGALAVGIFVTLAGYNLGLNTYMVDETSKASAITNLILGIIFLFFAVKSLVAKDRKFKIKPEANARKIFKWFSIGILVNATNFDALFLNLTAAKEVGSIEQLSGFVHFCFLCFNLFFFTLPITLPVFLYVLFPKTADKVLTVLNNFLKKYCKYIIAFLFFLIGIMFLLKGIKVFV